MKVALRVLEKWNATVKQACAILRVLPSTVARAKSAEEFGVLYIAANEQTALLEVKHHQTRYWSQVDGMNYERFVFHALKCVFNDTGMMIASALPYSDSMYNSDDYSLDHALKQAGKLGLQYNSVRSQDSLCWALFTPLPVHSIVQTSHYEMIWNGSIISTNRIINIQLP